jgi:2,4-dienoyl-CoA reductase-like NADH-dependent reductase (Old Yellow Enzyme family)
VSDLLFEAFKLRGLELRNRLAMSPMCQYSSRGGMPNEWHFRHYFERAIGGIGLVVVEATAVLPEGRITPGDLGIWDDEHAAALGKLASAIKAGGAAAGIQLAHAGRKASTSLPWEGDAWLPPASGGWTARAPSPIPYGPGRPEPSSLTDGELEEVAAAFASAARRAVSVGFDLVELHSAHGYLLHEFLSPLSNAREDRYGGDLEGRMRFPLEVARAVRAALPESMPMLARLSATDWIEGGWDIAFSVEYAAALKVLGVDLVDCSSGGLLPVDAPIEVGGRLGFVKPVVGPLYQVPFARTIREGAKVATGAVGLVTQAEEARSIVEGGAADLVSLARLLLRDPYWPIRNAPADRRQSPVQYLRAFR